MGKERFEIIDACRGVSIMLMVVYHFFYDLVAFCSFPAYVLYNPFVNSLEVFFASLFIIMSGASTQFTRSNKKRAVKTLLAAAAVTLVTWIFDNSAFVLFGILHFLGFAALIYGFFGRQIDRIVEKVNPAIFIALFFVFRQILNRPYNIRGLWALGIYTRSFMSTDYFPMLPWIFIYFFGIWFG
ncbi:MAG: heparan-alpha-glucosaminide N-acetyltransferase domain-containing protein, partial [Bacillota bacterium]|nr:heparan-alpha-glucosaminide N-acetyltransferase domain-containing protein [Bacillota bacterium]